GEIFLDRADRDRAVPRLLDDAISLAQPILRADAAADLGEGVGELAEFVRLAQAPLRGQLEPVGDVVVQRAMALAVRHTALRASRRLLRRPLRGERPVDLVEVPPPLIRFPLRRHDLRHVHEPQHPSPPCSPASGQPPITATVLSYAEIHFFTW